MFNKQDEPLYKDQFDEGMKIEPNYYVPIIPLAPSQRLSRDRLVH